MLFFSGFHLLSAITRKFQGVPGCAFFGCFFFFCLCPRLLTWHSSLKLHFKKEEGQERWKFSSPSSWLGGGGGGKECGGSCCGPRALVWLGLPDVGGPWPCGLSSRACGWPQKHTGQRKGNHGRKLRPAKATRCTKSCHSWSVITTRWSTTWQCWGRWVS